MRFEYNLILSAIVQNPMQREHANVLIAPLISCSLQILWPFIQLVLQKPKKASLNLFGFETL